MSAIDSTEFPVTAPPRRQKSRTKLRQSLRAMRDNVMLAYAPEDFNADIIAQRILWRRIFVVNEPEAIRHITLDNAANYTKTEVGRRILEPGLGRGLLTSEGETWKRHRRIMAPSFDPRSIAGYAPIMTDVTEALLAKWDALPAPRETDVAAAMMHATLHIISRAMFSSDSDEIVDVVEAGVNLYQSKVRPSLPDLLHLPKWLARLLAPFPTGVFSEFDKKVDRLLTERGRSPDEPKDLLARLISARDTETGGGMTPKEVRDQVVTIFMAGHETTSQALSWTFYLLSQNPAAEAKLHDELSSRAGRPHAALRRSRQASLHAHGDRGIDAALSAGAHIRARADRRRRSVGSPHPGRLRRADPARGCCIASRRCGKILSASIRSALRRSTRRRGRALPTSRSAPVRASASAPLSRWRKRC